MVLDKIENSKLYAGLSEKIAKAFAYINETDLHSFAPGRYEIDNGDIFALIQEYDTKEKSDCKLEGHKRFIDVQYIISGAELIGITQLKNQIPTEKNDEDDYAFYECATDFIKLDAGMFAIFFPEDLHKPCIKLNQISRIKKIVIKVKI